MRSAGHQDAGLLEQLAGGGHAANGEGIGLAVRIAGKHLAARESEEVAEEPQTRSAADDKDFGSVRAARQQHARRRRDVAHSAWFPSAAGFFCTARPFSTLSR